jgi:hypothetical protein
MVEEISKEHVEKALKLAKEGDFDGLDRHARFLREAKNLEINNVQDMGPAVLKGIKSQINNKDLSDYSKEKRIAAGLKVIADYKILLDDEQTRDTKELLSKWLKR